MSALMVFDRTGRVQRVNPGWTDLFGYTLGDTPSPLDAGLYADVQPGLQGLLERMERDGDVEGFEARLLRRDGSAFHGQLQCAALTVGDDSLFTVWVTDLSAQRQHASAAEQAMLLQNLQTGIVYTGDGKLLRANPRFAAMFGFADTEALVGEAIASLYADVFELQRFDAEVGRAFAAGVSFSGEWNARRQDGSQFQAYARIRPLETADHQHARIWIIDDESDIRRVQEARQDNETYSRMFQESHIAISIYDPLKDCYTDCNDAARKLYGLARREDLLGRNVLSVSAYRQEDGRTSEELLAAGRKRLANRGTEMPSFEWRHRRPDGTEWIAEVHSTPFRYRGGVLIQFTIIDITAVKEARRQMEEMAVFLQTMIDRMPNAVFYKGPDTRFMGCNQVYEQNFGVPRVKLVGKRTDELEFLPLELRTTLQAEHEEVLAQGGHVQQEVKALFADGKMHHVLSSVSGFRKPDGSPGGLVGVIVDLDPLKAAEDALRLAHKEQLAIFETAGVGIAVLKDGVIQRCNRKLEEMFGYEVGELHGKPTRVWYPSDEEYESFRHTVNARIGQGRDHRNDKLLVRKGGGSFWCRMSASYIDNNSTHGSVWFMEDVTAESEAAEALREAKRLAEESAQTKSMFLANMSHEIRTPMNAIIGMSYLALKTELNPRQRGYVANVHNAGTALLGIINDILDFSKVEAGKLDIESVPFRLDDVLASVSSLLAQKAYDKGLELLFDTAADVPQSLLGDPLRLGQIITNLVSNAVKFTENGQILISVRQLQCEADAVQLQVGIKDSGIGMTKEQTARLFQAFSQADGSTTRKYGGTGLGLTISKRLVELMGGTIGVDSVPGEGSLFHFTVNFGIGEALAEVHREVLGPFKGMRALVVDDNATAREIFASQLSELGFDVSSVESGALAIEAVQQATAQNTFGLMLVDWMMPGLDGIETVRQIRSITQAAAKPPHIVMATAYGQDEVRARAEAAGINAFIVKPVNQSMLVDTLVAMLAPQAGGMRAVELTEFDPQQLLGARLLLAEDNEINQQIAVELLQGVGAVVEIANNGREAVDMLQTGRQYDAILMDLQMPVMDGMAATRQIRSEKRYDAIPIIAMTAHAMVEERERCLAAGMVDHITKPIDPQAMFQTLSRWVRTRSEKVTPENTPAAPVAQPATKPVPDATLDQAIPDIPGLESALGLQRVAGNRKLYRQLLRQFVERQADAGQRIVEAIAAGDHATAERTAHTVRGVAGNIGLTALQQIAATLEQALRGSSSAEAELQAFGAELARAVAALQPMLAVSLPPAAGTAAAPASAQEIAQAQDAAGQLAVLLAASDGETADHLALHRSSLAHALGEATVARIENAAEDYDFDAALETLREAAAQRGIAIGTTP